MKFLCDVHISYKLSNHLISLGFSSVHVNEILDRSNTKDSHICKYADDNDLIVITKDSDFRDFFFINGTPKKLIKVNLGNISNKDLIQIFTDMKPKLRKLYAKPNFLVEIDRDSITWIELE